MNKNIIKYNYITQQKETNKNPRRVVEKGECTGHFCGGGRNLIGKR